jgi:hypothetical protein
VSTSAIKITSYSMSFRRNGGEEKQTAEQMASSLSRDVRIHFAGLRSVTLELRLILRTLKLKCRDTVLSKGVVGGKVLPLTSSAQHICIFCHALALDERRVKFLPEYISGGDPVSASPIPGSHSDM